MSDQVKAVAVGSRFWRSPFEGWVAVIAIYAGIGHWFLSPSGNAVVVQAIFPRLVDAWSFLYALGGVAILYGFARGSYRAEAAGLCFLGSGVTVSFIAFLVAGAPVLPTLVAQGGAIVAAATRLFIIRRLA